MTCHAERVRAALALWLLAGTASADSDVTHNLSATQIATLAGCWRVHGTTETWTFRANANHGLDVVRELGREAMEGDRARIPHPVMFSNKNHNYAFTAAGRIHGVMVVFKIEHATLSASFFSTHDGKSYFFTGNNAIAERCAQ